MVFDAGAQQPQVAAERHGGRRAPAAEADCGAEAGGGGKGPNRSWVLSGLPAVGSQHMGFPARSLVSMPLVVQFGGPAGCLPAVNAAERKPVGWEDPRIGPLLVVQHSRSCGTHTSGNPHNHVDRCIGRPHSVITVLQHSVALLLGHGMAPHLPYLLLSSCLPSLPMAPAQVSTITSLHIPLHAHVHPEFTPAPTRCSIHASPSLIKSASTALRTRLVEARKGDCQ